MAEPPAVDGNTKAQDLPAIYLLAVPDSLFPEDTRATAITADGRELATHIFLDMDKARRRLENAHGLYRRAYPDGYRLVWAEDDPDGVANALRLRQAALEAARPEREAEHQRQMEALRQSRQAIAPTSPLLTIVETGTVDDTITDFD